MLIALASISFGAEVLRAEGAMEAVSRAAGPVTSDELTALANDVNLPTWTQLARSDDFKTIEEGWVAVYSPKDAVGATRDWSAQVKLARSLAARTSQPDQRRWLGLFIEAGEAVSRKDSVRFTRALRAIENKIPASRNALAANLNFFTAK